MSVWYVGPIVGEFAPKGYGFHVFAQFACNSSGVRVHVTRRRSLAYKFARNFAKLNKLKARDMRITFNGVR